jgi:P-type Ca2+ transporter type 2C
MNEFHSKTIKEVSGFFEVDTEKGLSEDQVKKRREKYGKNIIPEAKPPSRFKIFISQFKSPLVFILAIAGIIVLIMGKYTDAIVIWAAVILNTAIGYFQENKAIRALDELKKVLKVTAKVIRSGNEKKISETEIVPGDLIVLVAGDKIPADARVIKSWNLKAGEAALTGEWIPSRKDTKPLDKKTSLADRENMVYMGTTVESGEGLAVVVKTGKDTEIGHVAVMVQGIKERKTPYQVKIKKFSWILASVISLIALFIFIEGLLTGGKFVEMFTLSIAVVVAAIPESLPIAFTAILAVGMQKILKEKGLVRHLTSAETLGSSSVIATDKTLTLTEGKMEVQEVYTYKSKEKDVLVASALANDAFIENPDEPFEHWIIQGNPTEKALLKASIESGISRRKILKKEPLVHKIPFDSVKKYISSFHKIEKGTKIYVSGAPESLINLSGNLSKKDKEEVLDKLNELTNKGLRVVASASRTITRFKKDDPENNIKKLDFLGFIAMRDPIRKGVKEAIELARSAGIHILMVTGDHPRTALAVARELNITVNNEEVIEGKEIDEMSDEELQESLSKVGVYARVEPKHKMRIINAWQDKGEVIAMTGDGINDAPALRKADIGIALGSGTDVAKEISDIILLEDKFSIIPKAIRQGRVLIDNIRKSITYMLSSAFSELILVSTAIVLGWPLPVTAVQILWVNLVEGALPGIAFTFEKGEKGVMKRKPEPKNSPLLNKEMKGIIFIIGIITDVILLGIFLYLLNNTNYNIEHIRTFIFVALIIDSLFYVFSCRNLNLNIWQYNPFSNKFINWTVILSIFLMLAVIYFPFLQNVFETVPLDFIDWLLLSGVGFINLFLIELMKYLFVSKKISN